MKTWRIWLILAVVFALGALAGAAGSAAYVRQRIRRAVREGHPPAMGEMLLRRLDARMQLTPEQRRQVQEAMTQAQERLQALHQRVRPERQAILRQVVTDVAPHLSPEQRIEFEAVCERLAAGPPPGFERGRRDRPDRPRPGETPRENSRESPREGFHDGLRNRPPEPRLTPPPPET